MEWKWCVQYYENIYVVIISIVLLMESVLKTAQEKLLL